LEQSLDKIEEIIKKLATNILVQSFLLLDQIMNDENIIIVAPSQDYNPLGLFQDQNNEDCNYPTLFLECLENLQFWPIPYQDIAQWELMHKDH
jgi:hypothetical protein